MESYSRLSAQQQALTTAEDAYQWVNAEGNSGEHSSGTLTPKQTIATRI